MAVTLFFSYSHADEPLRDRLEKALAMLQRKGVIETWHDRRIPPGDDFGDTIDAELDRASIILLLVSPDFLASRYCYDVEMGRALKRQEAGEARVIPVILRPCQWRDALFGHLEALPKDGKAITKYPDLDDAFLEVADAIKALAAAGMPQTISGKHEPRPLEPALPLAARSCNPRSSNLRLKKTFSDADRDRFLDESFEYLAKFFENSLDELQERNSSIETRFRRIDANTFTAGAYRNGQLVARCRIFLGSPIAERGIAYSHDDTGRSNSFNESFSPVADDQGLALQSIGFAPSMRSENRRFSMEGAAEAYWSLLIEPLQR